MVGRLLVGFVCLNLQFLVSWLVYFQWVRVAQTLVFCVMVGRLLVGFVWLYLQFSVSWLVDFQWVRVAQSLVFCVMVGRLLVGFVWLNLQFSVSWLVDFQWSSCGSIFSFLCHGWQTFSGVGVAQSLVFRVMVGRLLVGFVWLNLQLSVSWLVDFQWGSCGSIFSFLCHGRQTFSGVRVAQSLAFCVMVGKCLVGFVWLNLQFFVSCQVDFQWASCVSIFCFLCHGWQTFSGFVWLKFSFLCHGWQTFSGVRVAQYLVFCVMVGRLLVGSCGSNFSFLCHGWQNFSGVRVAQSLVFCVMVGRLLVGFVWFNLQFSVSWSVDFQWSSFGSIFSFLCHRWQTFIGVRVAQSLCFLCHGWQTFSGVSVAQSLVFCVMVGRLLGGFVWLNLQFSVSWLVDFQWASCGSIFRFLCHGRYTFSGVRVAQSFVFCVMVGRLLLGFVWLNLQISVSWLVDFQWASRGSIFRFLCHGWYTFSGVRVAQSFAFCVMVGRLLVGFVWLNLQFSVSWQVDFQWCSCGSIFSFLCHGRQTFSGVRVAQSLVFCVMVGRLLVGFVCLNLQFLVSWLVDFQLVRVAQTLVFCVMVGRLLVGFVWLNLQFYVSWLVDFQWVRVAQSLVFCVMVGRLLVGFVWLNLQFSVSWLVDFQWSSCGSIFSFLCHGWQTFSGVGVAQSLVFCVMVGRLLVGFVWLNLQLSASWLVDFQWASCGSIFSCLCHDWQTFSGVRVAQSLVFCAMVGRLLVGFVWLNLQFSVSWSVDFQWGSCGSIFSFVSWLVDFQWGSCGSIFSFLCHGRQTFSGVRVAQSLAFCVMVGRLLVGFVRLNLQFSVSRLATFSGVRVAQSLLFCVMVGRLLVGSCGPIFCFLCNGWQTFSGVRVAQSLAFCVMVGRLLVGSCGSNFSFLCHGWQTFSGVRVAQSLVFCVMVGRLLVGFVWLNLQFSVSRQVDFQWGSCGSIFSFLCLGWQTFSGVRVAQSLVFCVMVGRLLVGFVWLNLQFFVMVGRLLVGFVWLNLQFSVSWLVDFQWGQCGSNFSFLCHGWQTFSGVRVAQSLVFCDLVGRLLVGFVWFNLQISVSWQVYFQRGSCGSILFFVSWLVDFQGGSCGSIFSFLCPGWYTFSGLRVAQSLDFCVMVGILLVGFVWLNLQFSVSWLVDFQWGSCGSIFSFLCHGRQTFSGFVWLKLQFSVSWLVDFQWGSCGSIFSFLCHGWQTFSGFVWLKLQFSVSWLVEFQWGSCGSIFSFLCHGWQTFSGVRVAQSLVFCVMVGRLLVGFVWLNLQFSVSSLVDF